MLMSELLGRRLSACDMHSAGGEPGGLPRPDWRRTRARGFQIEEPTARDVLDRHLLKRQDLSGAVWELRTDQDLSEQLALNLALQAAIFRLKYWMSPDLMADSEDAEYMGQYWKKTYNSTGGAGDPEHFAETYVDLYL